MAEIKAVTDSNFVRCTYRSANVLFTVYHAVILGNVQLDAQIPFNVFIYL